MRRKPGRFAMRLRRGKVARAGGARAKKTHASAWVGASDQDGYLLTGIAAAAADLHTDQYLWDRYRLASAPGITAAKRNRLTQNATRCVACCG